MAGGGVGRARNEARRAGPKILPAGNEGQSGLPILGALLPGLYFPPGVPPSVRGLGPDGVVGGTAHGIVPLSVGRRVPSVEAPSTGRRPGA